MSIRRIGYPNTVKKQEFWQILATELLRKSPWLNNSSANANSNVRTLAGGTNRPTLGLGLKYQMVCGCLVPLLTSFATI